MQLTNTQTIIIDFRHNTTVPLPHYTQYDSNILKFIVKDNGADADLSNVDKIVVSTKRPDGIITQRLLQADGNIITYNIGNEEQRVVGYAEITLQFFNMENLLSSRRLKVYFGESLGAEFKDGAGYPILQELFIEVGEVVNTVTDAGNYALEKANETNEAILQVNQTNEDVTLAESERVINEQARQTAEVEREQAELDRQETEAERVSSEMDRDNNEQARQVAETERESVEIERTNAELARKQAETTRVQAEQQRQTDTTEAIANANNATQAAQEIADNTAHLGEYDPERQYEQNNLVSSNGSSYMAIQASLGIAPPSTDYWKLAAQRGVDGTGAVSTVNNISPDENGNVILTSQNIGAETPAGAQKKANTAEQNAINYVNEQAEYLVEDLNNVREELTMHQADGAAHGIGDKTTLLTTDKSTIVAAVNELFTNANNLKIDWAEVIGNPLLATDTSVQLKSKTQVIKNNLATNLNNKGVSANGTEALKSLADKVNMINMSQRTNGSGVNVRPGYNQDYPQVTINIGFEPDILHVKATYNNVIGYSTYILGDNNSYYSRTSEGGGHSEIISINGETATLEIYQRHTSAVVSVPFEWIAIKL
ncbi:hypothetical protein [Bacillus sp. Hm123]|uniref:hypothetical protein n=1 Tax=Bacillus sp. Hm123 TaxID=3450745 RepID=UPI003F41E646